MEKKRVVITGIGTITPLASGWEQLWSELQAGTTAVAQITSFDASLFGVWLGGEVSNIDIKSHLKDQKVSKVLNKQTQLLIAAAGSALEHAGLNAPVAEAGLSIGVGVCDYDLDGLLNAALISTADGKFDINKFAAEGYATIFPLNGLKLLPNMALCNLSIIFGCEGPNLIFSPHAEAGAQSIGEAYKIIQDHEAPIMLAGGSSLTINPSSIARFRFADYLSSARDADETGKRDGFILSEGSTILILEELEHALIRNAEIYAEITGYGAVFETGETRVSEAGAFRAMKAALENGQTDKVQVDCVMANADFEQSADNAEASAILKMTEAMDRLPIVIATKDKLGHLMAAAAATDVALAVGAINDDRLPPTVCGLAEPGELFLDQHQNCSLELPLDRVCINSFGFNGQHCSLVVSRRRQT